MGAAPPGPILAVAALAVGAMAMAASPVFVRLADVGPQASAFWRTFLALPFLGVWLFMAEGKQPAAWPRPAILSAGLSGVFFAGDLLFWHLAILGTTVANATLLATTTPIFVAIGAFLILSERVDGRTGAGIALCLAGAAALVGDSYTFSPQRLAGDAYGMVTALFFGCYMLAVRAGRRGLGAARISLVSTAVSSAVLLALAAAVPQPLIPSSGGGWLNLLGLAVISQVAGQGLLAVALGRLPATFSSLVIFIEALTAAIFGWLFFSESLGALQAFGGVLILGGIWVARPRQSSGQEAG